jgi:hypothetical protein
LRRCVESSSNDKENRAVNKTIFEEKWKLIRSQSTGWWSLMAEYDLGKVDKTDAKFDKFVTMLQVKYGYTRQKARDEIGKFWAKYESENKSES